DPMMTARPALPRPGVRAPMAGRSARPTGFGLRNNSRFRPDVRSRLSNSPLPPCISDLSPDGTTIALWQKVNNLQKNWRIDSSNGIEMDERIKVMAIRSESYESAGVRRSLLDEQLS